jgi:hypothetical protein
MAILKKLTLWFVPLVFLSLFPLLLNAQEMGAKQNTAVTGCVKQGSGPGDFYLTSSDGKMYEIMAHGVNLAEHVGHTVTLTGHSVKLSAEQESKKEATEKSEAGTSSYVDFQASSVKMVSTSCQ